MTEFSRPTNRVASLERKIDRLHRRAMSIQWSLALPVGGVASRVIKAFA